MHRCPALPSAARYRVHDMTNLSRALGLRALAVDQKDGSKMQLCESPRVLGYMT